MLQSEEQKAVLQSEASATLASATLAPALAMVDKLDAGAEVVSVVGVKGVSASSSQSDADGAVAVATQQHWLSDATAAASASDQRGSPSP